MKERLFECRSCGAQTDRCGLLFEPACCADPQCYEVPLWMKDRSRKQLLEDARMLRDVIEHAHCAEGMCGPWCNGVHAENGQCEGETGVWTTVEEISRRIGRD